MMLKSVAWFLFAAAFVVPSSARAELDEQTLSIPRVDGSRIQIMISRSIGTKKMPILLAIDGSLCIPSRLSEYMGRLSPETSGAGRYALVTVEKPEPSQPVMDANGSYNIGPDFQCTNEFKKYYSIDQRILDHLRAIQYLRRHAAWWDGRLFLWGFSDGARIATRVGAFTPEMQRMVLGGMGGGASMASELEDFHICPKERVPNREACIKDLRSQFDKMRDNPTSLQSWNGDSNTWGAWASRLDSVESNILHDVTVPILLFHGTDDKSVPVESARMLAKQLSAAKVNFVYREIPGMAHGIGSKMPEGKAEELQKEFLTWLFGTSGKTGH